MGNLIFYLLVFLSFFVPLYPKFPLFNVSGTYVAIRLEDFIIAGTFLIWFTFNIKNLKNILSKPITQAMVLFWGVGLLSLLCAIFVTYSVSPHLGFLNWLRRIEDMGLFIIAATSIKNTKQLKIFLITGLITAILVTLYGFGQYLGLPVISTTNSEYAKGQILHLNPGARPNSTFAGHYDLAIYLSVVLIFLGALFFWYKKLWQKGLLLLTAAGSAGLLGLTASRASYVAAILGLIAVFWVLGKRWLIVGVIVLSCLVVVAVPQLRHRLIATVTVNILGGGGAKYVAPVNPAPIHHVGDLAQVASKSASFSAELLATNSASAAGLPRDVAPGEPVNITELGVERSLNIRTDVEWPRALMAFEKNPILGTGYGSLTIATDNDFLRSLGEVGIFGTLALGLVFGVIIKKLWFSIRQEHSFERLFLLSALISIVAVLFTGTVIDVLEASKVAETFWILVGISWAVSNDYKL